MHPHFRALFNRRITPARYEWYRSEMSRRLGCTFEFRLAESPLFLTDEFKAKAVGAANAIMDQLIQPARLEAMRRAIPERWNVPEMDHLPHFAQIDFAVVRENGELVPKLIELQGFPSLTALQVIQRDVWRDAMRDLEGLDHDWSCWFSGHDRTSFLELARSTIVGDDDPAEVVLLDLDPPRQKTWPDFAATRILFGVDPVDPSGLTRRGDRLFRRDERGREIPIKRIYNRIVFDELEKKRVPMPFDFREALDVEWVPHPNWYWVWSKYSLPFLDHPAVPRATFVSDLEEIPRDLSGWVLKPLFSFAGGGVNVEPTPEDVQAIPPGERSSWCLQQKIEYEPALQAADGGGVKIEMRMMFLRPDDEATPVLAQNLVRLSRGRMLGVDFNKQFTWVGSSLALSTSS